MKEALRGEGNFDEGSFSDDSKPNNVKHLYNDTGDMESEDLFGASTLAKLGNMKAAKQDTWQDSNGGEYDESEEGIIKMGTVSTDLIKQLRESTGAGILNVRKHWKTQTAI